MLEATARHALPTLGHVRDVVATSVREAGAIARGGLLVLTGGGPLPAPHPVEGAVPVVLVHGYLAAPALLRPLARRLLDAGVPAVAFVGYPSFGVRLPDIVARIADQARPLAAAHGAVDLVGHSLGAVACRAWIKDGDGARVVRRFVSLGGPHAGTSLHRFVPGALGEALDPRGPWVARLADGDEPVPTTVVRARYDHQVFPPQRARIDGVHEVVLAGHGHNGLLFAREAHDAVVRALCTA
ncbi:MAG: hypothetical protein H6733_08200 [Alphaproteobacteria bacterium]|nr:hypothetical protein [Alphaproteobacteria bacterium]